MNINEYLDNLQKYTDEKIKYEDIAKVLKLKGKQAVGMRISRNQKLKDWEIEALNERFKKNGSKSGIWYYNI